MYIVGVKVAAVEYTSVAKFIYLMHVCRCQRPENRRLLQVSELTYVN